jgi:TPR repeat protein
MYFEKYTSCSLQELKQLADAGDEKARNAWCCKKASISTSQAEQEIYYTQAADRGCPINQFNLAVILQERGDIHKSKPLLEKSSDSGFEEAVFMVGASTIDGEFGFIKGFHLV